MFFSKLPKNVQEAIRGLTVDKVFQDRFAKDPVLDELDEEKFDPKQSYQEFNALINNTLKIEEKEFKQLTPAVWTYLWCTENPIVKKMSKAVTQADIDMFFYVLDNGVDNDPLVKIATNSFEYCKKNDIDEKIQIGVINTLIDIAFSPLRMFPSTRTNIIQEDPIYDSDWLSSMVARVHSVTGYKPDYIMNELSLTACCFYYAQYARMQGVQNISRRTSNEILKAQSERSCVLICDRLIELGVISEDQRAEMYKIMTTPPTK